MFESQKTTDQKKKIFTNFRIRSFTINFLYRISSFQIDDSNLIIQMVNVNDDNVIDWQKKSKKNHQRQRQGIKHQFTQKKNEKETIMCFIIIKNKKKICLHYLEGLQNSDIFFNSSSSIDIY